MGGLLKLRTTIASAKKKVVLFCPWQKAAGGHAEALLMQGRKEEAVALLESTGGRASYEGSWTEYQKRLQDEINVYESTYEGYEGGSIEYLPLLCSLIRDRTNPTTAARAAQYLQTAKACHERGDLDEAEAHLWQAVDSYKLTKEGSTSLSLWPTATSFCRV